MAQNGRLGELSDLLAGTVRRTLNATLPVVISDFEAYFARYVSEHAARHGLDSEHVSAVCSMLEEAISAYIGNSEVAQSEVELAVDPSQIREGKKTTGLERSESIRYQLSHEGQRLLDLVKDNSAYFLFGIDPRSNSEGYKEIDESEGIKVTDIGIRPGLIVPRQKIISDSNIYFEFERFLVYGDFSLEDEHCNYGTSLEENKRKLIEVIGSGFSPLIFISYTSDVCERDRSGRPFDVTWGIVCSDEISRQLGGHLQQKPEETFHIFNRLFDEPNYTIDGEKETYIGSVDDVLATGKRNAGFW